MSTADCAQTPLFSHNFKRITPGPNDNTIESEDVDEVHVSVIFGESPCYWAELSEEVMRNTIRMAADDNISEKSVVRKLAYRVYTCERYGFQVQGSRIQLPHFVQADTREKWPDAVGSYMGHKET